MISVDRNKSIFSKSLAVTRWQRGHQTFHLHISTINTVVDSVMHALSVDDRQVLVELIGRLGMLFQSATANMKYAADFPEQLYEDTIRPTMMPPQVSPGFSGSLNRDHKIMMKSINNLKSLLAARYGQQRNSWPVTVREAWTGLENEMLVSRKNHGLICKKFVADGDSLLKEYYTQKRQNALVGQDT